MIELQVEKESSLLVAYQSKERYFFYKEKITKIMTKYNILYLVIFSALLSSCKVITKIYYHDTSNFDDGEIWGDNVVNFFNNDMNIKITNNKSKELYSELENIRKEIVSKGTYIDNDDRPYEFAFITSRNDTIYSNGLIEWRYNYKLIRKKISIATNENIHSKARINLQKQP